MCASEKVLGEFQKEAQAVASDMEKCKSRVAPLISFSPDADRLIND